MRKRLAIGIGALLLMAGVVVVAGAAAGPPGYEAAYYNGQTVTMNSIAVSQQEGVLAHATAELYAVFYPKVALDAGLVPQCYPCDRPPHDHVLDSIPSDPGGGEFSPLWHVLAIRPNYTTDAAHNAAVNAAYLSQLPLKSEAAVDAFVDAGYAVEVDTGQYFICSIVNANAIQ